MKISLALIATFAILGLGACKEAETDKSAAQSAPPAQTQTVPSEAAPSTQQKQP